MFLNRYFSFTKRLAKIRIMKNIFLVILVFNVFIFANCQNKRLAIDKIWNKHLAFYGEKEKVLSIKSSVSKTKGVSGMGKSEILLKIKYPDKIFQEITYANNSKVTFILNGKTGIIKHPNGVDTMSVEDVYSFTQIALVYPEFYYSELGIKKELLGEKTDKNKSYYEIKITTPYEESIILIDKETYGPYKVIRENSVYEVLETERIDGVVTVKKNLMIFDSDTIIYENVEISHNIELNVDDFEIK